MMGLFSNRKKKNDTVVAYVPALVPLPVTDPIILAKEKQADAAVAKSLTSVEEEAARLRNAKEIASDLRSHREKNHFGERLREAFEPRKRD